MPIKLKGIDAGTSDPDEEVEKPFRFGDLNTADPVVKMGLTGLDFATDVLSGVASGVLNEPVLGGAIKFAASGGLDPVHKLLLGDTGLEDDLEKFALEVGGRNTVTRGSTVAGEFGASMAGFVGGFGLGKAALTAVGQAAAKRGVAKGVVSATSQAGRLATRAGDVAGAAKFGAKPALETGLEVAGSSLGVGGFQTISQALEGEDLGDAAKSGAIAAGLNAATLGTLGAGAKLFRARTTGIDPFPAIENFGKTAVESTKRSITEGVERITAMEARLARHTGSLQYAVALEAKAGGVATRAQRTLVRKAQRLERGINQRLARVQGLREFSDVAEIIPAAISRGELAEIGALRIEAEKFLQSAIQSPEGSAQKLGVTGVRFIKMISDAETNIFIEQASNSKLTLAFVKELAKSQGIHVPRKINAKSLAAMDEKLLPVFDAFERGGAGAVRTQFGDDAARALEGMSGTLEKLYAPVADLGGQPFMSADDLAQQGLTKWWAQTLSDKAFDSKTFVPRLAKYLQKHQGMKPEEALDAANSVLRQHTKNGIARFGSIDHQRLLPGTLKDKIDADLPFEGPVTGMFRYMNALSRRREYGKRFGYRGENKDAIVNAGVAEGAERPLLNQLTDHFLNREYHTEAMRRFAQNISSVEAGLKLAYAVVPNLTQQGNNAIFFGTNNAVRGMMRAFNRRGSARAGQAVGINEIEFDAINRVAAGSSTDNVMDRFARIVMGGTGFTRTEQWNRLAGANSAIFSIEDTFALAFSGRLRGNTLDRSRRMMGSLGLNLDKIVRQGKRAVERGGTIEDAIAAVQGPEAFGQAVFRGAQATQFIPSPTRIPLFAQSPRGRLFYQFKSFGLNQGIFLRDQVLGEAARGNMKPLATFLAFYPAAGEVVGDTLAMVKGRERNTSGISRVVEDISMVGSFGLVAQAAAAMEFGRLPDFLAGPAVGDAMSLLSGIYQSAKTLDPEPLTRQITRQPTVQLTGRLLQGAIGGMSLLEEYASSVSEDESDEVVTFDELRLRVPKLR